MVARARLLTACIAAAASWSASSWAAPVAPKAATIGASDPGVRSVELLKGRLIIEATVPPQHGDAGYIDATATVVRHVAEALHLGADAGGAHEIGFRFRAPAVSRLGRQHAEVISELIYTVDDLRKANLANLDTPLVLNLVERANAPAYGRHATLQWCVAGDHRHRARHYCRSALYGLS